jgi:hypothetical protein
MVQTVCDIIKTHGGEIKVKKVSSLFSYRLSEVV